MYFDAVSAEQDKKDVEWLGLLDNLEGKARQEPAELITSLLERGFDVDQIRGAFIPMLLPANRAIGDDGTSVSAREVSERPQPKSPDCEWDSRSAAPSAVPETGTAAVSIWPVGSPTRRPRALCG
ncbi:MAG TPA: adenylate cyclase regulatory domain-containing protein [Mycobacterium sp.]|nr:adenylate cyclase regulatory domain-containing protein [Mycobacterium sp.]